MTDIEKMTDTFIALGVDHKIITAQDHTGDNLHQSWYHGSRITWDTCILLEQGEGWSGFECYFYFLQGKYLAHAVVE